MGIPAEEVYNIFVNHKLIFTRSVQAKWTGHQKARENPFDPDLGVPVNIDECVECCTCVETCPEGAIDHSACE